MKKVVTITGGTGGFALLSELKKENIELKSLLSLADDGGSTGVLRKELDVFPPGDIRQCLVALSRLPLDISDTMNYRFETGFLKGHALGNIIISGLEKKYKNFNKGLEVISTLLNLEGEIITASSNPVILKIKLKNGEILTGEDAINKSKKISSKGLEKIYLNKNNQANKKALKVIKEADLIIIGPGNFYCSLMPILLVNGIASAINKSKATLFFVTNLINKKGHTDNFSSNDFIRKLELILGKNRIDFLMINNNILNENFVKVSEKPIISKDKIIKTSLISDKKVYYSKEDELSKLRSPIIHDGKILTKKILKTYNHSKK